MSIEDIFPTVELSLTEMEILAQTFQSPVVKKYLRLLALEDTKELLKLSAIGNQDSLIIKATATVQGKLQVIGTLLSIESASEN